MIDLPTEDSQPRDPEPLSPTDAERAEEAEFLRWYGPWDSLDPDGLRDLMAGFPRTWWIVGGWAIEAFTGWPREHEDVDLSILSCDVAAFRAHLGDDWTPWSNRGGTLRPLSDLHTEVLDVASQIWVRRNAAAPWVLDLPLTPDREGLWTNKRLPDHVAPVEEVTWVADDGIRYLAPEIVLLFKAGQDRPKDRRDLRVSWPLLSVAQRSWLTRSLVPAYGAGHAWLPLVAALDE